MTEEKKPKLSAVRTQVIEVENGVILKRGRNILRIVGDEATRVVLGLLHKLSVGGILSQDDLLDQFAEPDRQSIASLLQKLCERGFIVIGDLMSVEDPIEESTDDIFYWHFGQTTNAVSSRVESISIAVLGVNSVSRRLVEALSLTGFKTVTVVDYPLLCNLRMFDDQGFLRPDLWPDSSPTPVSYKSWSHFDGRDEIDCLVATSDFGGLHLMREWNAFAVSSQIPFISVVLQDLIGYIGPLVFPGETACFECFRARQNSHFKDPNIMRATESEAMVGQAVTGYHPTMASILGDVTAIELGKLFGGWSPTLLAGRIIEVNLLAGSMKARRVLKLPRCPVCSKVGVRSSFALDNDTFVPINEVGM